MEENPVSDVEYQSEAQRRRYDDMAGMGSMTVHTDTINSIDLVLRTFANAVGHPTSGRVITYSSIVAMRLDVPEHWVRIDRIRHELRGPNTVTIFWERSVY